MQKLPRALNWRILTWTRIKGGKDWFDYEWLCPKWCDNSHNRPLVQKPVLVLSVSRYMRHEDETMGYTDDGGTS
jgi:hypothetical protein